MVVPVTEIELRVQTMPKEELHPHIALSKLLLQLTEVSLILTGRYTEGQLMAEILYSQFLQVCGLADVDSVVVTTDAEMSSELQVRSIGHSDQESNPWLDVGPVHGVYC